MAVGRRGAEQRLDRVEGADQPLAVAGAERGDQGADFLARSPVKHGEETAPRGRHLDEVFPPVAGRRPPPDQPAAREAPQDAAQMRRIQAEVAADVASARRLAVVELIEHAAFGKREVAAEIIIADDPEPARVEAAEPAHREDGSVELPAFRRRPGSRLRHRPQARAVI
jgi:hypothetical protein